MSEIIIIHSGGNAELDPIQSGFAHGYGIFETIKLTEGRLAFWSAHWERLQSSAADLSLAFDFSETAVLTAIKQLVAGEGFTGGLIKLSLLRNGGRSKLFVYGRAAVEPPSMVQLQLSSCYPLNPLSLLAGHKTHNYMENMALLEAARAAGYYDTIRLDTDRYLAETTIGNLFFIAGGKLCTPSTEHGILPGVIRGEILKISDADQGTYGVDALEDAEAVFMTNSSCGLLPVSRIVGDAWELNFTSERHPYFGQLREALHYAETESPQKV